MNNAITKTEYNVEDIITMFHESEGEDTRTALEKFCLVSWLEIGGEFEGKKFNISMQFDCGTSFELFSNNLDCDFLDDEDFIEFIKPEFQTLIEYENAEFEELQIALDE